MSTTLDARKGTDPLDSILDATMLASIARSAVMARADYLRADKAWKDAESDTLEAFIDAEVSTMLIPNEDGTVDRVTAEGMDEVRRTVDMDAALSLLNAAQLAAVVSQAIAVGAIDAAVKAGVIPEALAAQVIKTKQVKPSIKVTFNAKPDKEAVK